jgi:hypothetical protein
MEIVESNPSVIYTTYYPHFVYQQSELSDHGLASELYLTFLTMVGHRSERTLRVIRLTVHKGERAQILKE